MRTTWIQRSMVVLGAALVALGMLSVPAQAQSANGTAPEWTYGVRVGASIADVTGDNLAVNESDMRLTGGAFVSLPLTSWLAVQPEVAYRPRAVKVSLAESHSAQEWRYTTHYLDVPVLLKAYMPSPGAAAFHLLAGPEVAFKLGESVDLASSQTEDLPPAFGESFRSTDVGIVVGGGLERSVDSRVFSVDARYVFGLTDLADQADPATLYDRSLTITLGIGF